MYIISCLKRKYIVIENNNINQKHLYIKLA